MEQVRAHAALLPAELVAALLHLACPDAGTAPDDDVAVLVLRRD